MNTTFQERSCWVSLLATGLVAAWFFSQTLPMMSVEELPDRAGLIAFTAISAVAVGVLVALQVAGHIVAALVELPEEEDERDKLIALRGDQISGIVLGFAVVGTIGHILAAGWFENESVAMWGSPFGVLNLLVGSLVLAEFVRCVVQIFLYRRGS